MRTSRRRLEISRVRDIKPRRDVASAPAYTTHQLRQRLAPLAMRLSPRRRAAAMALAVFGLASWFVIPSSADTYSFTNTNSGMRTVGEATNGSLSVYSNATGGYTPSGWYSRGYIAAGYWVMHDDTTGGLTDGIYCLSLTKHHDAADVMRDAASGSGVGYPNADGIDFGDVGYITTNYYPANQNPAGALADRVAEAAATQFAIWSYTDGWGFSGGHFEHGPHGSDGWLGGVTARAEQIRGDTDAHAPAFAARQAPSHSIRISATPTTVQAGGSVTVTATLIDDATGQTFIPAGLPPNAQFNVTGGIWTTPHLTPFINGVASATITATVPGETQITVSATLHDDYQNGAQILVPSNQADQYLGYHRSWQRQATSPTATIGINTPKTATPQVSKSVTDVTSGQSSSSSLDAKPGDALKFTITYGNAAGTNTALSGGTVSDDVSGDLSPAPPLQSLTPDSGGALSGTKISWTAASSDPGKSSTVAVTATVPQSITSAVKYCDTATYAPGSPSGTGPVSTQPVCVNVTPPATGTPQVTKTVTDVTTGASGTTIDANPGDSLTFTITYGDAAGATAALSGGTVSDDVAGDLGPSPALSGMKPDSSGTLSGKTVSWSAAAAAAGKSNSVTMTATVPSGITTATQYCDTATYAPGSPGGTPPVKSGPVCVNVKPAACAVPSPVLQITGPATFLPGVSGSYTVAARNGGTDQLSSNLVTLIIPQGWTVVQSQPTAISVNANVLTFDLGALTANQKVEITITVTSPTTASGTVTATAVMTSKDSSLPANCPQPKDQTASVTSSVQPVVGGVQGLPPTASGPALVAPVTGAGGTGALRSLVAGLCFMIAGLIVLPGLRRNPHARR